MDRRQRLGQSLSLAGIAHLVQTSVVSAHAGASHPTASPGVDPWQVAGPVVALLVSAATFWLANRDGHQSSPSHPPGPSPVETANAAAAAELVRILSGSR